MAVTLDGWPVILLNPHREYIKYIQKQSNKLRDGTVVSIR